MSDGALAGLTVLEVASYVSGPFAAMLLVDSANVQNETMFQNVHAFGCAYDS
jgi:hypothetical protein